MGHAAALEGGVKIVGQSAALPSGQRRHEPCHLRRVNRREHLTQLLCQGGRPVAHREKLRPLHLRRAVGIGPQIHAPGEIIVALLARHGVGCAEGGGKGELITRPDGSRSLIQIEYRPGLSALGKGHPDGKGAAIVGLLGVAVSHSLHR